MALNERNPELDELAGMIERAALLLEDLRRATPKARQKLARRWDPEAELEALCAALRATARPPS